MVSTPRRPISLERLAAGALLVLFAAATPVLARAATAASSKPAAAKTGSKAAPQAAPKQVTHTLPFIADDYSRALAEAKARQLPIFVESWAPW